jgi:branched-chain amino acid transport system ATP-binding protein
MSAVLAVQGLRKTFGGIAAVDGVSFEVHDSEISGGEQKLLEIARSLLLDPKLILIDEPSIGLSPLMVQETFDILKDLRSRGVTVLMVEQNAKSALEISDDGLVLELGRTRMSGSARSLLDDPRVGQLFLGGTIEREPVS